MSRESFLRALNRRNPPGKWSVGTGTSIVCQELMREVGVHFPQAHQESEVMAALAIAGHTVLGLEVVMPLFSVCHEAAALGCRVNWGDDNMMPESGKPIWRSRDDIRIPPDFLDRPACRTPLEAITLLRKRLGNSAAVCGKVFGGWTLGYHLFGVENFLIGTLDDPAGTRSILERLTPATISFAKAQVEAGADCILLGDHATRDLCSPDAYREFVAPLHAELAKAIPAPVILHVCGDTRDRIGMIAGTGLACFHWDTKTGSPRDVRAAAGERLSLMGGVSNEVLLRGRPEQVTQMALAAGEAGIDIVGPECAIPLATPLANLKAIAAALA